MSNSCEGIVVDITQRSAAWGVTPGLSTHIKAAVLSTLRHVKYVNQSEVSIVLVDDAFIQTLNKQYRGFDKPTNVLSFPQDDDRHLGDVVFAYEKISREAVEQEKSFNDHLTHLVVHGVLHLLGFDHETDEEAAEMEGLEVDILAAMGLRNPYV